MSTTHEFTSLRHPVEKLLESKHFLARMTESKGLEFQFELNAFLSASRSVTFVLQKALKEVQGFAGWYDQQQIRMKADNAMRFFLELRNISQKQGPVSYVGGALPDGSLTYRFVGRPQAVPAELIGRDICECCAAHLSKLANLLAECVRSFPFQTCPGRVFTPEGMATLGYSWRDVEAALSLPSGYTEVTGIPPAEKLRILSREIAPLDSESIERMASGHFQGKASRLQFLYTEGPDLVDEVAEMLVAGGDGAGEPRLAFLRAVMRRIDKLEGP